MSLFIDAHRDRFGVEPICGALQSAPSTYYARKERERNPCARALRDRELLPEIRRVHEENLSVYGAEKTWRQLGREGITAPRCQVERLMRADGLRGAIRGGKRVRTTFPDNEAERAPDLVDRDFTASAPNQLWVADFTYVAAWEATAYVAFVIDVFSRRIVGWRAARSMKTELVLDTIEMALWSRDHEGSPVEAGLIHHSDAGSQYTSFAFTRRLIEAGVDPSVGSVGDAYDNALAETTIGLFKTEMIEPRGPWKTVSDVELATLTWVDWFNHRRLHGACGDIPPVEFEENYLAELSPQ
jgi:putative transposase